jgi:cysteine synthase
MKVVHVLHGFGTGGMEKGVATVIRNASPDIEHAVVCLERSGDSERLLPPNTPVIELGKRPGHSFRFLLRLARTLKKMRPQVVQSTAG